MRNLAAALEAKGLRLLHISEVSLTLEGPTVVELFGNTLVASYFPAPSEVPPVVSTFKSVNALAMGLRLMH